ncbi:radical SAM/SPASM domain-containing protein [Spirochaetia bacterium]|nr:radical SAM/SPASM domain-containing protein [Spirochaetia bacterium]
MKHLNLLIKPASSLCNMRCRYCFYSGISAVRETASYGIMSGEITDKIINNVFKDINDKDEITFAFQGGEPALAGLSWYRHFVENVASRKRDITVHYAFQTNGLLIDESWCDFFRAHNFLIGLSIDASPRFHDRNRISTAGEGTWQACLRSKHLLDKYQVEYNILCVLTNDLAKEPDKAWRFIQNERIRYIQFIPCLDPPEEQANAGREVSNHRGVANQRGAALGPGDDSGNILRPVQFAKFYSRLLYWWTREMEKGNYISIKFFDDVVHYFCRGIPTACGINGQCHNQYVVEADGSVYPCDFYAFDRYKTGNLTESTLREIFDAEQTQNFLNEKLELPKICEKCDFNTACRGGCKRMRNVMYIGANEVVCGYRSFLEKCLGPLENTVQRVFQEGTQ